MEGIGLFPGGENGSTNVTFVDTTTIRLQYGSDYYDDAIDAKEAWK